MRPLAVLTTCIFLAMGCGDSGQTAGSNTFTTADTKAFEDTSPLADTSENTESEEITGHSEDHAEPNSSDSSGPPEMNGAQACPALDESIKSTPLYDHRIQWASSTDGVNFTKDDQVLLEHASVPDAVVRPDGSVWVYFVNGTPGQHAIFIAKQQPDGSLKRFDCIRIDGKINGNAVDPDIVRLNDGRYRLFFFEGWFVGNKKPQTNHPFFSAISEDGIHFTLESKILETTDGGTDPTAIPLDDGSWLLAITNGENVLLAKGSDSGAFELTGVTLPKGIPELARFEDGTIRLYIAGKDGFKAHRSDDEGNTWTEEATLKLGGADPSLITLGPNNYAMFYKTFSGKNPPKPGTPPNPNQ